MYSFEFHTVSNILLSDLSIYYSSSHISKLSGLYSIRKNLQYLTSNRLGFMSVLIRSLGLLVNVDIFSSWVFGKEGNWVFRVGGVERILEKHSLYVYLHYKKNGFLQAERIT